MVSFTKTLTFAGLVASALAQAPLMVTVLTPGANKQVGVNGANWMVDIVVEFNPDTPASAATAAAAGTSAGTAAAPAAATTTAAAAAAAGGGYSYRKRAAAALLPDPLSEANGYVPFLNSPGLKTFAVGANPFAPGLVVLSNTSSDPTQNLAGVFQLNAITNVTSTGEITQAYYQWLVGADSFGSGVSSELTVFFVNGTAPAKISGSPSSTPGLLSNVATVDFFIFGDDVSNSTSNSTTTDLEITMFTPSNGEIVGVDGLGWEIDLAIQEPDLTANRFAPSLGNTPMYYDNTTTKSFAAGASPAFPGMVVLCNATANAGGNSSLQGPQTNLAGLFQVNAVTGVTNNTISEVWSTWFVGAAFAGTNVPAEVSVFFVEGTAPAMIPTDMSSLNIISNIVNATFTISGAVNSSDSASTSASATGKSSGAAGLKGSVSGGVALLAMAVAGFMAL